jgi:hypothetical protein
MITKRQLEKDLKFYKELCEELKKEISKQQMKKHCPGVECKGCKNLISHITLSKPEFYCKLERNCNDFEEVTNNENQT